MILREHTSLFRNMMHGFMSDCIVVEADEMGLKFGWCGLK